MQNMQPEQITLTMHISVPTDRIVTSWLDMCYTIHHTELLSSLKY